MQKRTRQGKELYYKRHQEGCQKILTKIVVEEGEAGVEEEQEAEVEVEIGRGVEKEEEEDGVVEVEEEEVQVEAEADLEAKPLKTTPQIMRE